MRHCLTEILSDLGINNLSEYIVFLYAEHGLAVFESFVPGNAYYTFRYHDSEQLLNHVSMLTKSQMLLSSSFFNMGYHIRTKIDWKKKYLNYLSSHLCIPKKSISMNW